jgi:uncharacterized protein (TIGR02099 family)
MITHSKRLFWFSYWSLGAFVAFCALLVALVRVAYPMLPQYKPEIESRLSEVLGHPVTLGALSTYWRGQNPVLEVSGLEVEGVNSVSVAAAAFELNIPKSLREGHLIFNRFTIDTPVVRITAAPAPASRSVGTALLEQKLARVLALLLRQEQVALNGARLVYEVEGLPPFALNVSGAQLQTLGDEHQLRIVGALQQGSSLAEFRFVAESVGDPGRNPVNLHFALPSIDAPQLNPWLSYLQLPQAQELSASLELWGAFRQRSLEFLNLKAASTVVSLPQQQMRDIRLSAALLHHAQGYQAQIRSELTLNDKPVRLPLVVADWRASLQGRPDKLSIDTLDLAEVTGWLDDPALVGDKLQDVLATLKPQGRIANVNMHWQAPAADSFIVEADLIDVSVQPWSGAPGLAHINGRLSHRRNLGSIDLDSEAFAMHFPELNMPQWHYQFGRGRVSWSLGADAVEVSSGLLELKGEAVNASGRFFFRLPYDRDAQTDLALLIGVRDSDGVVFRDYIPPHEVGETTHAWLQQAIQGGQVRSGGFMLNANTRARLDDYQKPVVQLFLDVNGLQFGFDPQWPAVTDTEGYFLYRDFGFMVQAKGRLLDSDVREAWVYHPPRTDLLHVVGHVQGDARDIRRILTETPVRAALGEQIDQWRWSGSAQTDLDLNISLSNKRPPQVVASSRISEGRLESDSNRLAFEQLAGTLNYTTEQGLTSPELTGRLFGEALTGRIETQREARRGLVTTVTADGAVELDRLRRWLDLGVLAAAKGRTDYRAVLQLCGGTPACNRLMVHSSLRGVTVNAPEPLAKQAADARAFDLLLQLGLAPNMPLWINYADQFRGVFLLEPQGVQRAQLILGAQVPELPEREGLWISGKVEHLDVTELQGFLERSGLLRSAGTGGGLQLRRADLLVKSLNVGALQLKDLQATVKPVAGGWSFAGLNPILEGELRIPSSEQLPRLRLERLTLNDALPVADSGQRDGTGAGIAAAELPALDVEVNNLQVRGKQLGRWLFGIRPDAGGATFQQIQGEIGGISVTGDAHWRSAGAQHTVMLLNFDGEDVAPFLEATGYGRLVESKHIHVDSGLIWPGAPWQFAVDKLAGNLNLLVKNGRIIEAGKSGQLLRVLGILNLETVGRRLRLDFSDLYAEGLAFDRMSASYLIESGIATTQQPFKLSGPSADMVLSGQLDLVNETVEQDMEVVLPVTKNLPIMGVLLGQPQVAGAVYLIDKLIGNRLEKFTTIRYHLSGDWSDPKLELKHEAVQGSGPSPAAEGSGVWQESR